MCFTNLSAFFKCYCCVGRIAIFVTRRNDHHTGLLFTRTSCILHGKKRGVLCVRGDLVKMGEEPWR